MRNGENLQPGLHPELVHTDLQYSLFLTRLFASQKSTLSPGEGIFTKADSLDGTVSGDSFRKRGLNSIS